MKPLRCLLVGAALWALLGPSRMAAESGGASFRVMSYNVRYAAAQDGEDSWDRRRELFFEPLERFQPDLVGFQEVLAVQRDALMARLGGYAFRGVARDDGQSKGEWSLIGYRQDRFTFIEGGDFWLSEQPDVPGSKSWDAALPRLCTWVRLRDRVSGRVLVYANTHFDHRGVVARREASRMISERISALAAGGPAILTGDLNLNEDSPAYALLVRPERASAIRWIDSFREVHPARGPDEASFHGFKGTVKGSRIDFVFHTADFRATESAIDRFSRAGRYPSDHYPVTARLVLP